MERKIFEQEESLQDKKKELELKQELVNQLVNNINHQSNESSIKGRKLQYQAESLESFDASTMLCPSRIVDRKEKYLHNFSPVCKKTWKLNPSTKSSSYHSKIVRQKGTFYACSVIHGGSSFTSDPVIEGVVDTLNSKFRTKQASSVILNSKSKLLNSLKSEVGMNWLKSFKKSEENKLRSLNTYYFHDVLGKRKYLNLRQANKQARFQGHSVPNYISYKELSQAVNT